MHVSGQREGLVVVQLSRTLDKYTATKKLTVSFLYLIHCTLTFMEHALSLPCERLRRVFEQVSTPCQLRHTFGFGSGVHPTPLWSFFFLRPNHTANLLTLPKGAHNGESLHFIELS